MSLHESLSEKQREAVTAPPGPILVLAGAGSGKTRVLTHRIADLVRQNGVPRDSIFAVTFTNKAAAEMRERVARLLASDGDGAEPGGSGGPWISTFHSACVRILRRDGDKVGLKRNFVIFDENDQFSCLKSVLKLEGMDEKAAGARGILYSISRMKNRGEDPASRRSIPGTPFGEHFGRIAAKYAEAMREASALDFDDLLLWTVRLFRERTDVTQRYATGPCRHTLVDEYQDTNPPQYELLKLLAAGHRSLFVVGDEDQSIYRWRGAEIRNLLDFERDFPEARVVKLEENYRSTGWILKAANSLIANNSERKGKVLWTRVGDGEKPELLVARDERAEARFVIARCRDLTKRGQASLGEVAVFYRTNAQSRVFEEELLREGIPYEIIGGTRFYERKEVRDALAYLKVIANPQDRVSLKRALQSPPRGIGPVTIERIEALEKERGIGPLDAFRMAARGQGTLPGAALARVQTFVDLLNGLELLSLSEGPARLVREVLEKSGLREALGVEKTEESTERLANLDELLAVATEYELRNPTGRIHGFLDELALVSDVDSFAGEPNRVVLMTLHSAKGLEFPVVFLTGLEEGLFPHVRSLIQPDDVEEERRLCYVGMTRAKRRLILTCAANRYFQGVPREAEPSRFLEEIAPEALTTISWGGFAGRAEAPYTRRSERRAPRRDAGDGPTIVDYESSQLSPCELEARERAAQARERPGTKVRKGSGWQPGDKVGHPTFGQGVVRRMEGDGESRKVTVFFPRVGEKKLMLKYASLTKL